MSTNNELNRVLTNPANVILSSDLESRLLAAEPQDKDGNPILKIGDDELVCSVRTVQIEKSTYVFGLSVPLIPILKLLKSKKDVTLKIEDLVYRQDIDAPIEWHDNLLTITTRRILNETVQT